MGGYFIGGSFTHVGGLPRGNLAHILANGEVDPAFVPDVNDTVESLALSGAILYAGGKFTEVGGESHGHIAAIQIATGDPVSAWTAGADERVLALAVSGGTVYAGGEFSELGGQPRNHLAAVDATTGAVGSWNPNVGGNVKALGVVGSTVYAAGEFSQVGAGRGLARFFFRTTGVSTGFECALVKPRRKAAATAATSARRSKAVFKRCRSPKKYGNLARQLSLQGSRQGPRRLRQNSGEATVRDRTTSRPEIASGRAPFTIPAPQ